MAESTGRTKVWGPLKKWRKQPKQQQQMKERKTSEQGSVDTQVTVSIYTPFAEDDTYDLYDISTIEELEEPVAAKEELEAPESSTSSTNFFCNQIGMERIPAGWPRKVLEQDPAGLCIGMGFGGNSVCGLMNTMDIGNLPSMGDNPVASLIARDTGNQASREPNVIEVERSDEEKEEAEALSEEDRGAKMKSSEIHGDLTACKDAVEVFRKSSSGLVLVQHTCPDGDVVSEMKEHESTKKSRGRAIRDWKKESQLILPVGEVVGKRLEVKEAERRPVESVLTSTNQAPPLSDIQIISKPSTSETTSPLADASAAVTSSISELSRSLSGLFASVGSDSYFPQATAKQEHIIVYRRKMEMLRRKKKQLYFCRDRSADGISLDGTRAHMEVYNISEAAKNRFLEASAQTFGYQPSSIHEV